MTAHHIYLMAPGASPDDIRRFYRDALGLNEAAKPDSLTHIAVLWFDAGGVKFHIGHPAGGVVGDGHMALATDDLEAVHARLLALGFSVDDNAIPMGYPRFYACDPWGNQFEILPSGLP